MAQSHERPFPLSKDALDTLNSITWFMADGIWMLGFHPMALGMIGLTLLSGLCLLYIEKRLALTLINLSILSWATMNMLWIASEYTKSDRIQNFTRFSFGLGVAFILAAAFASKNVRETFSHFRRFRIKKP